MISERSMQTSVKPNYVARPTSFPFNFMQKLVITNFMNRLFLFVNTLLFSLKGNSSKTIKTPAQFRFGTQQKKSRWKFCNNHINKDIYHARILLREQFTFLLPEFCGEFQFLWFRLESKGEKTRKRINCGFKREACEFTALQRVSWKELVNVLFEFDLFWWKLKLKFLKFFSA